MDCQGEGNSQLPSPFLFSGFPEKEEVICWMVSQVCRSQEITKEEYKCIAKDIESLIKNIEAKTANSKMVIGERFEIDMALDKLKAASEYVKSIIIMKI